jgi:sec-independent protein translocase protein TatA
MQGLILAFLPSGGQWIVIALIGLLLFGKKLPEVGRSLGKGIVEFKKGLKGVEGEIEQVDVDLPRATLPTPDAYAAQQKPVAPAYKFDPYTGKPIEVAQPVGESQKVG